MKRIRKVILIIVLCLSIGILSILFYYNRAFHEALVISDEMVEDEVSYNFNGSSEIGFIIFPGVKADERAYAYLAKLLHDQGHTVIIPKIRFHMAASPDQGIRIMDAHTEISKWYLIGHSAGGMSVSQIAEKTPENLEGIILLASYLLVDISEYDLKILRITASEDGIMNEERMQSNLEYLPKNAINVVMEGANHQGFGAYDSISKDGEATLTWKEQQDKTVKLILDLLDN